MDGIPQTVGLTLLDGAGMIGSFSSIAGSQASKACPMTPKILIVTTCRWLSAARLAMAFAKAGCIVEAICPSGHPLLSARAVQNSYAYHGLTPLRSLRAGILPSKPDLIVPCDDLAMKHLHHLYDLAANVNGDASKALRELIEFSLGDPAGYPVTESRDNFMAMVHTQSIRTPETKTVASAEEVETWVSRFGLPAVLKADGTSGGEGVKIVHTLDDALRAYQTLHAPLGALVAAKRACLDRDWNCVMPWLAQRKRAVSIQSFVAGSDANMAIACWQGKILSSISVEVLQTWKPKGPATIVRLIENDEMYRAAEKILGRLKFSGLCGLDFMLDSTSGSASLIEMNARATQTSPLPLGPGRDLIASMCSTITGKLDYASPIDRCGETIALFPLAWQGDTSSDMFQSAYHDIPWEEPELVRQGMTQARHASREKWIRLFHKLGLYQS